MIYFIRHAQSTYNQADSKLYLEGFAIGSPEHLSLKFDEKFCDCGLTQNGRLQSLKAKKQMQQVQIDLVIVSPMRRTIQTCDIIFNEHKSKPLILVEPGIREIFSSSCDIGNRIFESMNDFPHFDYNLIKDNQQYWYIDSIKNTKIREMLLSNLEKELAKFNLLMSSQRTQEVKQIISEASKSVMIKYLKENFGLLNQKSFSDFDLQKRKLKEYFYHNKSKEYKNIAIVSHHDNIMALTGIDVDNAEVVKVKSDHL